MLRDYVRGNVLAMARKFFSGFETADFSEWVTDFGAVGIATDIVRSGQDSMAISGSSTGLKQTPAGLNLSSAYVRFYIYFDGDLGTIPGDTRNLFINGATIQHINLRLQTGGAYEVHDGLSGSDVLLGTTSNAALSNQWNLIEFKIVVGASGIYEMKINGVVGFTTVIDNTAAGNIDTCELGCYAVAMGIGTFFDDFSIDDSAYCGEGKVITRQGKSGTPTSDGWTKVGGATIDAVWSDTPFSATADANTGSITGALAQTMLTASFATTQSGHGSEVISVYDTIDAIKVGAVAKIDTNTAASGVVRRIFGGVTTDGSNIDLTTADAYYETAPFTGSLTNLNASEIGFNKLVTGAARTVTVEDVWMMVEYTFVTPPSFVYERPDADDTDGGWTNEAGGASLFDHIDEIVADDADYIWSVRGPVNDLCKIRLSDQTGIFPANVTYRYAKVGDTQIDLTVKLLEGASTIATWTHTDISTTLTTVQQDLTGGQFASIVDLSNMYLSFSANQP